MTVGFLDKVLDLALRGLLEAVAANEVGRICGQVMAALPGGLCAIDGLGAVDCGRSHIFQCPRTL